MKEVGLLSSLSMQALNASGSSKIARHLADIPKLGIAKCNSCLKSRPPRQAFKPSPPGWESAFPADASPGFFETRGTAPARRNWGHNCKRAGPLPRCDGGGVERTAPRRRSAALGRRSGVLEAHFRVRFGDGLEAHFRVCLQGAHLLGVAVMTIVLVMHLGVGVQQAGLGSLVLGLHILDHR